MLNTLNMLKKFSVIIGLFIIMILFSGTASALEKASKDKKNISVIDNGVVTHYDTSAETVKEFLIEKDINISKDDKINYKLEDDIKNNMQIKIERAFITKILIDNSPKTFLIEYNETVGDFAERIKKEYGYDFVSNKAPETKIRNCRDLNFSSKQIKITEQKEIIPFETKIELSDELQKDKEKIIQDGQDGEKIVTYETVFVAGKEISHYIKSENIINKPIEKIILRGTREYKDVLVMNASAYTAGFESTGKRPGDRGYGITATGTRAVKGTVAVDPRVIPLGTKLYIEGYGYATALDTGGAIKGNKIDLFYDSLFEARKFGRKNITVYVLY